jgi:hypothetical protein
MVTKWQHNCDEVDPERREATSGLPPNYFMAYDTHPPTKMLIKQK